MMDTVTHPLPPDLRRSLKEALRDIRLFARLISGLRLRKYQEEVALAIVDSVVRRKGLSFVVIFPRQSGKNELQAQIETYLLTLLQRVDCEIVKLSPTWKPQSQNAMRRLERTLKRNMLTRGCWQKEQGYIYRVGRARIAFLSAAPGSNIVGATASTLLECDEAQDVEIDKWDREIAPMAASTNATRVFWGTAWTSQTLLAREKRAAHAAEKIDGVRRVFELTANEVRAEAPAYGQHVDEQVRRHGRDNPAICTQYFSEEIDAHSGMFPAARLRMMQGDHHAQFGPRPGAIYAFGLDVGGTDFGAELSEQRRLPGFEASGHDLTALTVFEVEPQTPVDGLELGPRFLTVWRRTWSAVGQVRLLREISALVGLWGPQRIVVDATGVGEGLASFLLQSFGTRVIPFKFTRTSKSELGWRLISLVESGRYKEYYLPIDLEGEQRVEAFDLNTLQNRFYEQCRRTMIEILPGAGQVMRWGVPEGARSLRDGELLHDDLLLSVALCATLAEERWGTALSTIIQGFDPLSKMSF